MKKNNIFVAALMFLSFGAIALFSFGYQVHASTSVAANYSSSVRSDVKQNDPDMVLTPLTEQQGSDDMQIVSNDAETRNFLASLTSQGYHQANISLSRFNNHVASRSDQSITGDIHYQLYKDDTGDAVLVQFIVDNVNSCVAHVVAQKLLNGNSTPKTIFEYSGYKSSDVATKSRQPQFAVVLKKRKSFHWDGKSFACSLAGLFACGEYCGVWAVVNVGAGATCSGVCGIAWAAVCSLG